MIQQAVIRAMMTPEGTLGFMKQRNSVVVYDQRQAVDKVKAFLTTVDRQAVNVRVQVEFLNTLLAKDSGLRVTFDDGKAPSIIIRDGKIQKPESINVDIAHNKSEGERNTVQFIVARSGHPARIWAGTQVPDPNWLRRYTMVGLYPGADGKPKVLLAPDAPDITWREVGSSMYILPTVTDNGLITVELFPVVSFLDGDSKRQNFRVQEVKTTLTVQSGARVYIGGNDQQTRNFLTQLLGPDVIRKTENADTLNMYLTAEIMDPRKPNEGGLARPPIAPR